MVSVIMSAFNEEAFISSSIESIIEQTYSDWELIIIDDASTDQTSNIITHYVNEDSRIRFFKNKSNEGLAYSLNKAVVKSNGDFLMRMDADDICFPYRMEKQLEYLLSNPQVSVLGGAAELLETSGAAEKIVKMPIMHEQILHYLLKGSPFIHPSVMMTRSFFDKTGGYNPAYKRAQDYDLWLRGKDIAVYHNLEIPLIRYRAQERQSINSLVGSLKVRLNHFHGIREFVYLVFWFMVSVFKRILNFTK